MSQSTTLNAFFIKYKNTIVKVKLEKIRQKTDFFTILSQKYPGKKFPLDTTFVNERETKEITDILSLRNGDVVRVVPPQVKPKSANERPIVVAIDFDEDTTIERLKILFGLDESVDERRFAFVDRYDEDGFRRFLFAELNDDFQLARALKCDGLPSPNGKTLSVKRPEGKLKELYLREKRKPQIVEVKNVPRKATEADLRIFFSVIPIYSIHLMKNGTAFLEVGEEDLYYALKFNGEKLAENKLSVKESDIKKLFEAIKHNANNQKPIEYGQTFVPQSERLPVKRKREEDSDKLVYENKDFKCILMVNLPEGTTDLDIARFFDDIRIQPLLIHLKRDGTEAYCEFNSVKETDKAIEMDNRKIRENTIEIKRVRYTEIAQHKGPEEVDFVIDQKDLESYKVAPSGVHNSTGQNNYVDKEGAATKEDTASTVAAISKKRKKKKKKKKKMPANKGASRLDDMQEFETTDKVSSANKNLAGNTVHNSASTEAPTSTVLAAPPGSFHAAGTSSSIQQRPNIARRGKTFRNAKLGHGHISVANFAGWDKTTSLNDLLHSHETVINNIGPDFGQRQTNYGFGAPQPQQPYGNYMPSNSYYTPNSSSYQSQQRRYFDEENTILPPQSQPYHYGQQTMSYIQQSHSGFPSMSNMASHSHSQMDRSQ